MGWISRRWRQLLGLGADVVGVAAGLGGIGSVLVTVWLLATKFPQPWLSLMAISVFLVIAGAAGRFWLVYRPMGHGALVEPVALETSPVAKTGLPIPVPPLTAQARVVDSDVCLAITSRDPERVSFGVQAIGLRGAGFTGNLPWPLSWVDGGSHNRDLLTGETQLVLLGTARIQTNPQSWEEVHFYFHTPMGEVGIGTAKYFAVRVRVFYGKDSTDYEVAVDYPYGIIDGGVQVRAVASPWEARP